MRFYFEESVSVETIPSGARNPCSLKIIIGQDIMEVIDRHSDHDTPPRAIKSKPELRSTLSSIKVEEWSFSFRAMLKQQLACPIICLDPQGFLAPLGIINLCAAARSRA
jgi:hypothetical protein